MTSQCQRCDKLTILHTQVNARKSTDFGMLFGISKLLNVSTRIKLLTKLFFQDIHLNTSVLTRIKKYKHVNSSRLFTSTKSCLSKIRDTRKYKSQNNKRRLYNFPSNVLYYTTVVLKSNCF